MNTIVISMINPSYCSYVHQLNAIKLGHHLVGIRVDIVAKYRKHLIASAIILISFSLHMIAVDAM